MKTFISNSNMVQSCWSSGHSFNIHCPTYVGFYFKICAPSNKQKVLICIAFGFLDNNKSNYSCSISTYTYWIWECPPPSHRTAVLVLRHLSVILLNLCNFCLMKLKYKQYIGVLEHHVIQWRYPSKKHKYNNNMYVQHLMWWF